MTTIYNRIDQKEKRRELRNSMPKAEKMLWERLKKRQIKNKRFLRQYSIGRYVIDFYCPEIKFAIEADGDTHNLEEGIEYDLNRQNEIENLGIRFLRIKNDEIYRNIEDVLAKIEILITQLMNNNS
ncbi:MAG: endonuclease domain-containing protein [Ignavibacteria bacterium]|nr:endonuclease domain-containing protein [Ignavibacteria bacterium]